MTSEQKLRMTIHKDVRSICQEAAHFVGMEVQVHAMELIGELVWKKLQLYGADLELFAKHAKRSTINSEDVKLLVRRNPSLKEHISKLSETIAVNTKENKRKRTVVAATSAPNSTAPAQPTLNFLNNNQAINTIEPMLSNLKSVIPNITDDEDDMVIESAIDLT